jgi:hypothetical protein
VQGDAYPEIGLFLIRLTCDPEKLDEISAACQEVISTYVSQGPTDTELASAKIAASQPDWARPAIADVLVE